MLGTTLSSCPGLRHLDKVVAGSPTVVTSFTPRLSDQQRPEQVQDDVRVDEAVRSVPTLLQRSVGSGLVTFCLQRVDDTAFGEFQIEQ